MIIGIVWTDANFRTINRKNWSNVVTRRKFCYIAVSDTGCNVSCMSKMSWPIVKWWCRRDSNQQSAGYMDKATHSAVTSRLTGRPLLSVLGVVQPAHRYVHRTVLVSLHQNVGLVTHTSCSHGTRNFREAAGCNHRLQNVQHDGANLDRWGPSSRWTDKVNLTNCMRIGSCDGLLRKPAWKATSCTCYQTVSSHRKVLQP
jgi:hypothetical protein